MRISVLIADDFPLVREGLTRALGGHPAITVVGTAADGDEAIARARELKPDVILLDLFMPGLGGILVLEQLRAEGSSARVLIVTASEREEALFEAMGAGAAGYLTKRSTGEELRQAIISVHGGGLVITPSMAGCLLSGFARRARGSGSFASPTLTAREREIIRLRYGLADGYTYTLEEVGKIFSVTRERVRQIEAKAVRKLQHPVRCRPLGGFIDQIEIA